MNDPHVVSLRYELVSLEEGVSFDAPPVAWEPPGFALELSDNTLTATPQEHYASAQAAQDALAPYLRAWETAAALVDQRRSGSSTGTQSLLIATRRLQAP